MNKSINNDINKFDGKYLKCIVSKYNSVLKYVANSGAMVVLQPTGDKQSYGKGGTVYQRNYRGNQLCLITTQECLEPILRIMKR